MAHMNYNNKGCLVDTASRTFASIVVLASEITRLRTLRTRVQQALGAHKIIRHRLLLTMLSKCPKVLLTGDAPGPDALDILLGMDPSTAIYCAVCRMYMNGPTQFRDHMNGRIHRKSLRVRETIENLESADEGDAWGAWNESRKF